MQSKKAIQRGCSHPTSDPDCGDHPLCDLILLERVHCSYASDIYRAFDMRTQRECAVKITHKIKQTLIETRRSRQGLAIHRTLSHPNIVQHFADYETDDDLFLVTEFCSGNTLENQFLTGSIDDQFHDTIISVLSALDYLHREDIIHANVQSRHILFADKEKTVVKLTDFAISFFVGQLNKLPVITHPYQAPEVRNRHVPTPAIDVWNIGCLLVNAYFDPHRKIQPPQGCTNSSWAKSLLPSRWWEKAFVHSGSLIVSLLQLKPSHRPAIHTLRDHVGFVCPLRHLPPSLSFLSEHALLYPSTICV